MKRIWFGALAALLLLTACGQAEKPAAAPTAVPAEEVALRLAEKAETEKNGVLLKIESFEDGMLHIRLINHSGKTWYYGESYSLFKRNAEDGWTSVPDDRSWIMIAYELEDGDEVSLALDLSPLPLETGTYKLVRDGMELPFRLIMVVKDK